MRTDIPSSLTTAMALPHFEPVAKVYAQPHLPKWEIVDQGGTPPDNPFGHDAKVVGEYIYRVRGGGIDTWDDGFLYFARIPIAADPSTWETYWTQVSDVEAALPAWKDGFNPGQPAVAVSGSNVRLFYFAKEGSLDVGRNQNVHKLYVIESDDDGENWDAPVWIAGTAVAEESFLQIVALTYDLILFTDHVTVFDPTVRVSYGYEGDAAGKAASVIRYASYDAGWTVSDLDDWPMRGFYFMGRTARDADDILKMVGDATTWGDPVWAGLGAAIRPDGLYTVASGAILANSVGLGKHSQGIYVLTLDSSDMDMWWQEAEVSVSEYANEGFYWDLFARVSNVNGVMVIIWKVEDEPTDVRQTDTYTIAPRRSEVVYSYSLDGVLWTEPQSIVVGVENVGTGPMVLAGNILYMVGWYHIMRADVTHVFKSDAPQVDITNAVSQWDCGQTGRTPDTHLSLAVVSPDAFDADPGDLITIKAGAVVDDAPVEVVVSQGYLDTYDETLSVEGGEYHVGGPASAKAAGPLTDTRARDALDILPQEMMIIEPTDMLTQISAEWGDWTVRKADANFWARAVALGDLFTDQTCFVECSSFADGVQANAWHHQHGFLTYPVTMNGQFTVRTRMGLEHKDYFGYAGTKNWPAGIYSTYVNGFGDRWGGDGYEADLDYAATGVTFRGKDSMSTYVFAWEPALRSWNRAGQAGPEANGTCHPDTSIGWVTNAHVELPTWERNPIQGSVFGSEAFGGYTIAKMYDGAWAGSKDNALVLYMFVNEGEGEDRTLQNAAQKRYLLAAKVGHGLVPGDPVELHVVTYHGYIYCYYRTLYPVEGDWELAFTYDAGVHFGAGRFGLYGRGWNGPEGSSRIPLGMRNRTWFWDVRMVNNTRSTTVGDVVRGMAWRAGVETSQDNLIEGIPTPGQLYDEVAYNPVIDASVSLAAEAGFLLRGSDVNNCVRLGIVPGDIGTGKLNFQTYVAGVPTKTLTVPTWFNIPTATPLQVRVCVNENWYSLWIGTWLLGTVYYQYKNSSGIGLYGGATWLSVAMPELYEQPQFATLDSNQSMMDAIDGFLDRRRIKRFLTYDGKLRLSYYTTRAVAGTLDNTMVRSQLRRTDRQITHCRVMGGLGWAEYKSTVSSPQSSRRFTEIQLPDVMQREAMYKEARAAVIESNELRWQANFAGYPNLILEPEDQIEIIVDVQSILGDFIIDDLALSWTDGKLTQQIGTRQVYIE